MELSQIAAAATDFFRAHMLISIAALAVIGGVIFYSQPKKSFKLLLFAALMALVGYFILQIGTSTDTGVSGKEELTNKTKKALGD